MADLKHITRINDTRANLLANLDVHQSSIATDNNSNGYKGYSWKDGAGNLLEAAAINKDVSFVDITATGDVFVSAFTAAGIVKNAATTGLLIGGNLVENTDLAILGTSGTLAKFGSTGLVVSKLIESGVMMGFNLTPYSGNVAVSIGSLFEIDAKDGYGDIQLINYGNNFGIAKNLYFNDTPSTDTWRLKTSANASLLLFLVDSLYYYGQASGTAGAVAALKEVFYASPSTGFHVNSAAQVTAGYFTVSSVATPYLFNISFATGLSEFNGNVLLTTTNQTRYRDTATYISSKNANCLDIDASSQVRVNSGYLQTIATVAGTTGVWNEVINNVQSGIVKDDVSGGYRVYGRDNTTNIALLSEMSTIHNTIPAGASDLNPRLEFRLYDYPGGLVTWMTLLNDGSITLSKYGVGIAHFSAAGSISSSTVVNGDFGNLGTTGTIPKFATNGLSNSIIKESAQSISIGCTVNSGWLNTLSSVLSMYAGIDGSNNPFTASIATTNSYMGLTTNCYLNTITSEFNYKREIEGIGAIYRIIADTHEFLGFGTGVKDGAITPTKIMSLSPNLGININNTNQIQSGYFIINGKTISNLFLVDFASDSLTIGNFIRHTSANYRRYYHMSPSKLNPGAGGATWINPGTDPLTLGGYNITNSSHILYLHADVHADWDAASNLKVEVHWRLNDTGLNNDTVDLRLICYYGGEGETTLKTQTVEVPKTTTGVISTQYTTTFTIDYDASGNVVEIDDQVSFLLNLETDTSEIDNIIVEGVSFYYNTKHIGIESTDV